MSTPTITPTYPVMPRKLTALLGLLLLMLGTLAAGVALTAYLLRVSVVPKSYIPVPPPPAPFRLLYLRAGQIWSMDPDGRQRQVTRLPDNIIAQERRVLLSPDGKKAIVIAGDGQAQRAWLLPEADAALLPLAIPGASAATGRQYVDAAWLDPRHAALLVTQEGQIRIERYALSAAVSTWSGSRSVISTRQAQALSLSPDGTAVALAFSQRGSGDFAPQVVVRLQQLRGTHSSIVYRYLGTTLPLAVIWAPDRGTVVIQTVEQGLAIQKSSGRPVRLVPTGSLPAVFSQRNAQVAYVDGRPGSWKIHVLRLHGETDQTILSGLKTRPSSLCWTPDARALLYVADAKLWEVNPSTGASQLLSAALPGTLLQTVPLSK